MKLWPGRRKTKNPVPEHFRVFYRGWTDHADDLGIEPDSSVVVYAVTEPAAPYGAFVTCVLDMNGIKSVSEQLRLSDDGIRGLDSDVYRGRQLVFVDDRDDPEHYRRIWKEIEGVWDDIEGASYMSALPQYKARQYPPDKAEHEGERKMSRMARLFGTLGEL